MTYTTAHGNTRSFNPLGLILQPTSSWILVGFVIAEPKWELLFAFDLKLEILSLLIGLGKDVFVREPVKIHSKENWSEFLSWLSGNKSH